jgi:uncharacterized protein YxjI
MFLLRDDRGKSVYIIYHKIHTRNTYEVEVKGGVTYHIKISVNVSR